jgi:hypothetical protein
MLNQDERRRFNEIAHHLTADSEFVRQVRGSLPADRPPSPSLTTLWVLLAVFVPLLLAFRWWAAAVVVIGVLSTAIVTLTVRRHRTT